MTQLRRVTLGQTDKEDYSQWTGLARKITFKEQDWQERLQSMNRTDKEDYGQWTGLLGKL